MIDYHLDDDGIATITWNVQDRPMNVINSDTLAAFGDAVEKAVADDQVSGVIVASARKEFIVGADLAGAAGGLVDIVKKIHVITRQMETGGKPFVAAINGHALGGGYEFALSCHRRIAADTPRLKIGLPEAKLGLLPGGGGTQRLPRLIGAQAALPLMLEGRELDQQAALKAGLIDDIVPADQLLTAAKAWLKTDEAAKATQPWDKKGFRMPGGAAGQQVFVAGTAMLRAKTQGNYPAQQDIMSAVYEGSLLDIDSALAVETRYFVHTAGTDQARNMVRFFFSVTDANKLGRRPAGPARLKVGKVGVLGAGMMGAGIAYASAKGGIDVVLLDTSLDQAEKGKSYSAGLIDKAVRRKRLDAAAGQALLERIHCTTDYADLAGVDLVIEAVFEDRAIKADVTKKTEAVLAPEALFASNTSTLPITGLAEASSRPDKFVGLHFFSPVDRMPLVEIIRGAETSDGTLAHAMDYVKAIAKTPIVVNDSRGFFTSRVFATYVGEGIAMLAEGINPALIENAGKMAGMPVGPLALADEVSIELMHRIRQQTKADLGSDDRPAPSDAVVALMAETLNRMGKKVGKGFYDYPDDGPKRLWPDLGVHFQLADDQPDVDQVIKRLIYIQSVETARCLEENVVTDPRDADVGSVLGWGFAPFRGGAVSQIDTVGVGLFVAECDRLAQTHGERFLPPDLLRSMAEAGKRFYAT